MMSLFRHLLLVCLLIGFSQIIDSFNSIRGGSDDNNRIVGGTTATRLGWPWMTLIILTFQSTTTSSGRVAKCGGSLISDEWVLTAAHCVSAPSGYQLTAVEMTFGEHDINRVEGSEVRVYADRVQINNYNPSNNGNDLALIHLSQKLDLSVKYSYLKAVPLSSPELVINTNGCIATGWGLTSDGGSPATTLQEVRLPIMSNRTCRNAWGSYYDQNTQLCAGYPEGGKDTCQGDSGGPLCCQLSNGVWVLEGVTSFGAACAAPGSPGVYTKVPSFRNWIRTVTGV